MPANPNKPKWNYERGPTLRVVSSAEAQLEAKRKKQKAKKKPKLTVVGDTVEKAGARRGRPALGILRENDPRKIGYRRKGVIELGVEDARRRRSGAKRDPRIVKARKARTRLGNIALAALALSSASMNKPADPLVDAPGLSLETRLMEGVNVAPAIEGHAYDPERLQVFANYASSLTGVKASLILAVLEKESASGRNIGQCRLTNPETGAGVNFVTGQSVDNVMNPSRDVGPFIAMAAALGRDPYNDIPVSCPAPSGGWGGAFSGSQTTADLYMNSLNERILEAVRYHGGDMGIVADPFEPTGEVAVLATAFTLQDNGAASTSVEDIRNAVGTYYGGSKWRERADAVAYVERTLEIERSIDAALPEPGSRIMEAERFNGPPGANTAF